MRKLGFMSPIGIILASLAIAGCENNTPEAQSYAKSSSPSPTSPPHMELDGSETTKLPQEEATKPATAGRKIIYNAHVDLVTEDLNKLEDSLTKLITTSKAYVADSDRTGSAGATRHGTWKVRVPVNQYDPFVKGAVKLGELVSIKADSQDVSEEFFDLEARETAKKVEEARLLKHLADSTGKLEEILAVERELSRVRSEIERMEGRLRALANLTSLATVTITASEIKDYVPPQAPTLGTRLARTFAGSLETLRLFGEAVLIFLVAIVPWLPFLAIAVGIVVWISRRGVVRIQASDLLIPAPPARDRN
jgi:Domain of unknown function (DUF4349)